MSLGLVVSRRECMSAFLSSPRDLAGCGKLKRILLKEETSGYTQVTMPGTPERGFGLTPRGVYWLGWHVETDVFYALNTPFPN